ncbi:hypothetical protein UY3_18970 [Chelonia mydas]|uniref:Uncharacterized protein n=1 Tax=Chelonia mydas TaxID=8469 RepID=M7AGE0_CHEMY|nr:hypothetical protein UY3_18970 [Chelonia mydas]
MIDSQFMEKDLNNVLTFELEKHKFELLGKAKKKSAACKVEKEVNGELKQCSFKTSEASALKSFNLWRHVKCNHPENYVALVTKKDQEDEAKPESYLKMDAATDGNRKFPCNQSMLSTRKKEKDKAVVKTLDIINTEGRHNSLYVKSQVKAILEKFGISEMQVLSICIDNAANMICAIKNFSEDNETISASENRDVDRTEAILPDEGTKGMDEIELNMDTAAQWGNDPSLILPTWLHEDDSKV